MCRWRQSILSCYVQVEAQCIELLCAGGDSVYRVVMCKWRQSVLSCYVQVETEYIELLCASGDRVY